MPIVFNATNEEITTKAHGNWFHFKPKQMKIMTDAIAMFLITNRAEEGFVGLPDAFEDPSYKDSPEGKDFLKKAEKEGIERFLKKQQWIYNNNVISLKRDLGMANIDTDPRAFMSDGEQKALELLAKYQAAGQDEAQKRVEHAKELEKRLGK